MATAATIRERVLLVPKPLDDYIMALFARATLEVPDQTAKSQNDFICAILLNGSNIMELALNEEKNKKNVIVPPDAPLPDGAGEFMKKTSRQWKPL